MKHQRNTSNHSSTERLLLSSSHTLRDYQEVNVKPCKVKETLQAVSTYSSGLEAAGLKAGIKELELFL